MPCARAHLYITPICDSPFLEGTQQYTIIIHSAVFPDKAIKIARASSLILLLKGVLSYIAFIKSIISLLPFLIRLRQALSLVATKI